MQKVKDLLKAGQYQELQEYCAAILEDSGKIFTPLFGLVTQSEHVWLDKKIKEIDKSWSVDELSAVPCYVVNREETKNHNGGPASIAYPFVDKFYEMRAAKAAQNESYAAALELFS